MSIVHLGSIALDGTDPGRLSAFWAGLLGGEPGSIPDRSRVLFDPAGHLVCMTTLTPE